MSLLSSMKESNCPASPYLAAAMDHAPSSSSPSSVLSTLSPHSSSSLSKFSPSSISPLHHAPNVCPTKPSFSLLRKRKGSTCKWVSRLFRLDKLSMEADEGLLLHRHSEGLHGSWGDADDDDKVGEKPKKELRFAAKIAAAMDADGFLGVKDSVCADDKPIGMQTTECVKKVGTLYGPAPAILTRAPLKQARPRRRRWRLLRRLRRTRVLFSCMLLKVRTAFTTSSKRTPQVRDGFIK